MIGKNALWVAKQHGHSIATMLRAYAAWAEGAVEVDVGLFRNEELTTRYSESWLGWKDFTLFEYSKLTAC